MRLKRRGWCGLCFVGLISCASQPIEGDTLRLIFITESDPGVLLSGVSVWVDNSFLGSSRDGEIEGEIAVGSERVVRIRYDCPEGHNDPVGDRKLKVRPFEEIAADARGLEVTLKCPPRDHIAAFVVRATNAPSLPVLVDGVEVTHTNQLGVAQFSRRGEPGTEYTIRLDTSADPRLLPQHPASVFTLEDQHEVFIIDQTFERARKPYRKPPRKSRIIRIE